MTEATTAPTLQLLPVRRLHEHPRNPRTELGNLDELTASITAKGVLQPLVVAPASGSQDGWVLIAGHRRAAAARAAGATDVPCVVRDDLLDPSEQLEAMLVENLQRADLSVLEEGDAYQALLDYGTGYTVKRLTAATGRATATVKGRLAIAHLPAPARARVAAGQISIEEGIALADFAGDDAAYRDLSRYAGTSNWSWALQRAKETRARAKAVAKARRDAGKAGVSVIERPGDDTPAVALVRLRGDARRGVDERDVDDATRQVLAGLDDEQHTACPGHVALITEDAYGEPLQLACTDPSRHLTVEDRDAAAVAEATAADVAATTADLAREQLDADLRTATKVRREHLRVVMLGAAEGLATGLLREHALRAIRNGYAANVVHDVLELEAGAKPAAVKAAVEKLSLPQLAVLLDLVDHAQHDRSLEYTHGWPGGQQQWSTDSAKGWRTRLDAVYYYGWSDVEQGLLEGPVETTGAES